MNYFLLLLLWRFGMASPKTTNMQSSHPVLSGKPNKTFLSFTAAARLAIKRGTVSEKEAGF